MEEQAKQAMENLNKAMVKHRESYKAVQEAYRRLQEVKKEM